MKTVKFFASALLSSVLLVSTAVASEGEKSNSAKASENTIREQISSALSDVALSNQGTVFIYFAVTPSKGFELLNVSGNDVTLINKVKRELISESISAPEGLKGNYMLKVVLTDKNEVSSPVIATEALRDEIASALSKLDITEKANVKLVLSIKDNTVKINKVEGASKTLASSIEQTISSSNIYVPSELSGKYELKVQF